MRNGSLALAVAGLLALAGAGPAQGAIDDKTNLLDNGSAETGLSGWSAPGWIAAPYDPPGPQPLRPFDGAGSFFFSPGAQASATLALEHSFSSAHRRAISDGGQPLSFGGWFGGAGTAEDFAFLRITPLALGDVVLGAPVEVGGPSARDRDGGTRMLPCHGTIPALPPETYDVRVEVVASGSATANAATADGLYLNLGTRPTAPSGAPLVARGCEKVLGPTPAPTPEPRPLPTPGAKPATLSAAKLVRSGTSLRARFRLSKTSTVRATVRRCTPRCRTVRSFVIRGKAGTNGARLVTRVKRGRYRVTLRPVNGRSRVVSIGV